MMKKFIAALLLFTAPMFFGLDAKHHDSSGSGVAAAMVEMAETAETAEIAIVIAMTTMALLPISISDLAT